MRFSYVAKERINKLPKAPGVYSFWNKKELLYIGKAGNLRTRVKTHFAQPNYRDNLFIEQVTKIGFIETQSEIEALLLESTLIKERMPKYNVMWKDGKSYFFIAMTKEELPRVFLTHQPRLTGFTSAKLANQNTRYEIQNTMYIGPFVEGTALKRTLRSLRRVFPYYTKKHGARSCQYCNLGLCPGPNPNIKQYKKNISNLAAVLQGKRTSVRKKLEKEMKQASRQQDFEYAGKLRDQIHALEIVFQHANVLRPEQEKQSVDWPAIEEYLQKVFRTKRTISRVEAYDISNTQGNQSTGSMPVFIDGKPSKKDYRKFKVHISGKPNDFAMMEEVLKRRLAHTEWGYPDLIIIDGGKGQLSAALNALHSSKIQNTRYKILTAAIAKKHNELFIPNNTTPLLLAEMPQPVSNFILHIRDEAHRFAITYHRLLRKKSMI